MLDEKIKVMSPEQFAKLKIGDVVRIRRDLNYEMFAVTKSMVKYAGMYARVTKVRYSAVDLDVDDGEWYWYREMLEEDNPFDEGKVVDKKICE